ncbi:CLUMA_CG010232, isoform A [Clunio marinus]|uniref:CLUMA_CG010232, isoform A n=1 Tax=Clunio marinus TaxID=568069 RepID=A0A1J1I8F3_9DIPT|nr:CLUMA_CG010232, isoform A [Clunio marinus]
MVQIKHFGNQKAVHNIKYISVKSSSCSMRTTENLSINEIELNAASMKLKEGTNSKTYSDEGLNPANYSSKMWSCEHRQSVKE